MITRWGKCFTPEFKLIMAGRDSARQFGKERAMVVFFFSVSAAQRHAEQEVKRAVIYSCLQSSILGEILLLCVTRKEAWARHLISSMRRRADWAKSHWNIPQRLMTSIDNSWSYTTYLPWRTSIHRMASDSVTLPKYAWVVLRSWCRRITFETISGGTPFRLA